MNSEIEKRLWKRATKYCRILQVVPFVRMIAVCNNLAFGKVDEKSDIDLFIVAKTGRLFFVRIFVTAILQLCGVRRHGSKVAGRFCLSFFVDDSSLALEEIALEDDIYLIFWMKYMVPLIDDGVSKEFLRANSWAERFFEDRGEFKIETSKVLRRGFISSLCFGSFCFVFGGRFGDLVEGRLKKWQISRARKKLLVASSSASLIVDDHMLKFHNIDRREYYKERWFQRFGRHEKLTIEKFLSL